MSGWVEVATETDRKVRQTDRQTDRQTEAGAFGTYRPTNIKLILDADLTSQLSGLTDSG